MYICFICETPYQVFNCVNIARMFSDTNHTLDIYIADCFQKSDQIGQALIAEGIFHSVNFYGYASFRKKISNHSIQKLYELCLPGRLLRRLYPGNVQKNFYDRIFISTVSPFSTAMLSRMPAAKVAYYDDGLGSYLGGIGLPTFSKGRKLLSLLTGHNYKRFAPVAVYLNNTQFGNLKYDCELIQIANVFEPESEEMQQFKRIFGYSVSPLYSDHSVILIDAPDVDENDTAYEQTDKAVKQAIVAQTGDAFLRPHPRQKLIRSYGMRIDNSNNFWELLCAEQITDDSCLIGSFSTAQMSPKMLFNKEPYLIFTYKLFLKDGAASSADSVEGLIQMLRQTYQNPQKIHVVESVNELASILHRISLSHKEIST